MMRYVVVDDKGHFHISNINKLILNVLTFETKLQLLHKFP